MTRSGSGKADVVRLSPSNWIAIAALLSPLVLTAGGLLWNHEVRITRQEESQVTASSVMDLTARVERISEQIAGVQRDIREDREARKRLDAQIQDLRQCVVRLEAHYSRQPTR